MRGHTAAVHRDGVGFLDHSGIHGRVAVGEADLGVFAQVLAVAGHGEVDVVEAGLVVGIGGIHGLHYVSAVLGTLMVDAFGTGLQGQDGVGAGDEVQIQQAGQHFVVGGGEADLAVHGAAQVLAVDTGVVLEAVHSHEPGVRAHVALQVGVDGVITVAERIVIVVLEGADKAGLQVVILGGVAAAVEGEILPDEAFVVPPVQGAHGFLGTGQELLPVIIAEHVELFVGDGIGHEGHGEDVVAPADIIAGGVGHHALGVRAQQGLGVVAEGLQALFELSLVGGQGQAQLVQPVLADEGVDAGVVDQPGLQGPELMGDGVLIPIDIVLTQQLEQVGQQILVLLDIGRQVDDAVHIGVVQDGGIGIGVAHVGRLAGSQRVGQVITVGPAAADDEFDFHVVLFQHALTDVVREGRGLGHVVAALEQLDRDVAGLGELAVHQFIFREGVDQAQGRDQRQGKDQ